LVRQANLTIAVAIFAGAFAFAAQLKDPVTVYLSAASVSLVMGTLLVVEHQLHKYSEGWQGTRRLLVEKLEEAFNDPRQELRLVTYKSESEEEARLWSLRPMLYFLLALGGGAGLPAVYHLSR
jgi:hypothetical protein